MAKRSPELKAKALAMLGRTEHDSVPLHFYNSEGNLVIELNGQLYRLGKGFYNVTEQI